MIQSVAIPCPNCGVPQIAERDELGCAIETWPCAGDDRCTARVCRSCRQTCECGAICCSEHIADFGGILTCHICLRSAAAEAEEELRELVSK